MAGNWNSGRRRQPTALKILRGNPGKRRLSAETEPTPPALDERFTRPPRELTGNTRARAEWRRIVPLLRDCGLISQAERPSIIALCLEWSTYLEARATLQREGVTTLTATGVRVSPSLAIADGALTHCHRLWSELGLTPSGRAKVARLPSARVTPVQPASKWGGLL